MIATTFAGANPSLPKWRDELPWTDILGVRISAIDMPAAVSTIEGWIETGHRDYAYLCNVHSIMEADRDHSFKEVLNSAGLRCPDGMPLVWLSHRYGQANVQHVRGADLMLELCNRSQITGHRHFFYGGGEGVVDDLVDNLQLRFPKLQIAGKYRPGYLGSGELENHDVIEAINEAQPDILWIGLGCPKQEWWIANHRPLLNAAALLGVGAAFDFHSSRVPQAPEWLQRMGLEWSFRLATDPSRLWKRYFLHNSRFLHKSGAQIISMRRSHR